MLKVVKHAWRPESDYNLQSDGRLLKNIYFSNIFYMNPWLCYIIEKREKQQGVDDINMKKSVMIAGLFLCCTAATVLAVPADKSQGTAAAPAVTGLNAGDTEVMKKVESLQTIDIGSGTTILGPAEATQEQMVRYILQQNPSPDLQCSVEQLVSYYYEEGSAEGVRPDVALCQAIKETGCFAYGGDVVASQNNYCGLGATGHGQPGAYFATPQRGVRAHIQHLLCYATTRLPKEKILDPRYDALRLKYSKYYGKVPYWTGLNGKWAVPGKHYGQDILAMWEKVKKM